MEEIDLLLSLSSFYSLLPAPQPLLLLSLLPGRFHLFLQGEGELCDIPLFCPLLLLCNLGFIRIRAMY